MRSPHKRDQRGAALVEFAIIAPVFMMLILGMLEFGLVFKDYLTVANTTRAGARVGSAAGRDASADFDILQAVKAAIGGVSTQDIVKVVVFKSNTNGDMLNTTCTTASVASSCNVYTAADMGLSASALTASGKSNFWAPTSREDRQSVGADYLGIWVRVDHPFVTKMFGSTFTLTDKTVMRIEPRRT